jgi:hypothetical protein
MVDSDGLPDAVELLLGTDPLNPDTDGDGLFDGVEDANHNVVIDVGETDPLNPDTDSDGFSDGAEIAANTDPLNIASFPPAHDGDLNSDGLVNIVDVLLAERILTGQLIPTQDQLDHGDVAPMIGNVRSPDGIFNLGDVLVIQRKANGAINF